MSGRDIVRRKHSPQTEGIPGKGAAFRSGILCSPAFVSRLGCSLEPDLPDLCRAHPCVGRAGSLGMHPEMPWKQPLRAARSRCCPGLREERKGKRPRALGSFLIPTFSSGKSCGAFHGKGNPPFWLLQDHTDQGQGVILGEAGLPIGSSRWNGNPAAGAGVRDTNKSTFIPTPSYSHSAPRTGETFPKPPGFHSRLRRVGN